MLQRQSRTLGPHTRHSLNRFTSCRASQKAFTASCATCAWRAATACSTTWPHRSMRDRPRQPRAPLRRPRLPPPPAAPWRGGSRSARSSLRAGGKPRWSGTTASRYASTPPWRGPGPPFEWRRLTRSVSFRGSRLDADGRPPQAERSAGHIIPAAVTQSLLCDAGHRRRNRCGGSGAPAAAAGLAGARAGGQGGALASPPPAT